MKYYLETNALYSIEKIRKVGVNNCYTSIYSLFELVSGINENNFQKRKHILDKIRNSKIDIDYDMPEKIIFDSFDVSQNFEFHENRVESLNRQITEILKIGTYQEFVNSDIQNSINYDIKYFNSLDDLWNRGFTNAIVNGNQRIKRILEKENKGFVMDNKIFELKDTKDLTHLLAYEPALSKSISIIAFTGYLKKRGIGKTEEEIYNSYNGLIDYYIQGLSDYNDDKMIRFEIPAKNDFSDLTHLLYLRNNKNSAIVTNDRIFNKYFKGNVIGIDELINN